MKTYWRQLTQTNQVRTRTAMLGVPANGYTGADMAKAYQFPKVPTSAPLPTVWIPELGGDYDSTVIGNWCSSRSFPMPDLTSITAPGSDPPVSDPNGADVEVGLDIVNVISAVWYMFGRAAKINVLFCDNSNIGMLAAYQYILANAKAGDTVSLSWGGPESMYGSSFIAQFEALLAQIAAKGITCTFASGDNGPDDGTGSPVTDYPGCSAYGVDCGATTIVLNSDGSLKSQVPWNSGGGASGGGFSKIVTQPSWQINITQNKFRGEPDCVANGDPATGWDTPFGIVGGTSAVAPFMAAYFAGVNALLLTAGKAPLGLPNPLMYANEASCFTDVTTGGIGDGDNAGPGWDVASGLGSVIGTAFAATALTGQLPPPTNGGGTPPPTSPSPLPVFTIAQILSIIEAEVTKLEGLNPGYAYINKASFIGQVGTAIEQAVNGTTGAQVMEPKSINWGGVATAIKTIATELPGVIAALQPIIQALQGMQPAAAPKFPFPIRPQPPVLQGTGYTITIPSGVGVTLDGQQL